ncbi:DnaJ domain-containing protein [Fulvivirga ulvae]|uniref:DnaJ domain-containing protein n=1 Tax=Fulvivirga ulvae TaxID=2904245 RepID=UPI001F46D05D|nr:DnaJ domain-containing protein [Fulvivirga ulvae]UII32541.1 DnaJ domain-containing protein [Fulvivirga ulvae]
MSFYHSILEIREGASKSVIKNAYRKLAKQYHPDISTEDNAEEMFIEITEAYQYLMQGFGTEKGYSYTGFEDTVNSKEELRRERAQQYARMQFEAFIRKNDAFKKTWYYNPVKYFSYTLIYLIYTASIAMFLSPLLTWVFIQDGSYALGCILLVLISSHFYTLARAFHKGVKPYFENYS